MIVFPKKYDVECLTKYPTGVTTGEPGITPTSIATNKVINTNQNFANVTVGDYVTLACAPQNYARVTEVNSATELTLDADLITSVNHLFRVVRQDVAFIMEVDPDQYDSPEQTPNFYKFLSKGDRVEPQSAPPAQYAISGCRVISVDSPTRCTVDVPLSGQTVGFMPINSVTSLESEDVAVVYIRPDNGASLVVGNGVIELQFDDTGDIPAGVINGIQDRNVLRSDVIEAIASDVGGAWQGAPTVNTRELGGGEFVFD